MNNGRGRNYLKIREKITTALSLPKEITLDMPLIVMMGRDELNVENYKNLLEFSPTIIRVKTATGMLSIEGTALQLKQITAENLLITGQILGLHW